jgi:hypothetical protein
MTNNYLQNFLTISKSTLFFNLRKFKRRKNFNAKKTDEIKRHLNNLRVHGYSIVENFLSKEECASMIKSIDRAFEVYPEATWTGLKSADRRIFGAEHLGGLFNEFFKNDFMHQVGSQYFRGLLGNLQTLAGRIDAVEGNIGSGEGWHRDGNNFQFKSLVYLSDANPENGPFQLIRNSHRLSQILKDSYVLNLQNPLGTRFTDGQINTLLANDPDRLITLSAPAGTMVLVDVSAIHRGSPIEVGRRYAMFNYYYPSYDLTGRLEKFLPRLTPEMVIANI